MFLGTESVDTRNLKTLKMEGEGVIGAMELFAFHPPSLFELLNLC